MVLRDTRGFGIPDASGGLPHIVAYFFFRLVALGALRACGFRGARSSGGFSNNTTRTLDWRLDDRYWIEDRNPKDRYTNIFYGY